MNESQNQKLLPTYKMNHDEYLINLIKNLEINKKENDVVNFMNNIYNYLKYIYVNYPHFRIIINKYLIKYNLFNKCKLSIDLLKSFNDKNDKLQKLFEGGDKNTEKRKELQSIQVIELDYIHYNDIGIITKKIRKFLESIYELKTNNPNYTDNAKYQDIKYMDSVTFIINAKKLYKNHNTDFNKKYYMYEYPIIDILVPSYINPDEVDILSYMPYEPNYSFHKKINKRTVHNIFNQLLINKTLDNNEVNNDEEYEIDMDLVEDVEEEKEVVEEGQEVADEDKRWGQIYIYNNYKEYIEPIPFLLQKLDTRCCCNNSNYFNDTQKMTSIDIAKQTYKNEIDFLKKFINKTDQKIFMTTFDDTRTRCGNCECCQIKTHQIKITQLYHLLKSCIIFQTNADINSFVPTSKINISDIFEKKKKTTLNCHNIHNFKTVYEYIIENLISDNITIKKDYSEIDDINHYKYVAKIRDYIINNFGTNLFPIFDKKYCPDLMVSNFNADLFFFDFEINKIINNINEDKQSSFLITYIKNNNIIRNDIGFNYLKCLIHSYRDFLLTWYDAELKIKEIHEKMETNSIIETTRKIVTMGTSIIVLIDQAFLKGDFKNFGALFTAILMSAPEYKLSDEEVSLLKTLSDLITHKQFIYKNSEWNKVNNKLKERRTNHLFNKYLDLTNSANQIKSKLEKYDLHNFELMKECNYIYYLLHSINFLEESQKQKLLDAMIKIKFFEPIPALEILRLPIGGNNALSIYRKKNVSRKKLIHKMKKIISKKNNSRNRMHS